MTLVPWSGGKSAVWDVTVVDTTATSYVALTATISGRAADLAASKKKTKYTAIGIYHSFFPLAFETLGPIGTESILFLKEIGRRLYIKTGDKRETAFLFQRVSMAVQRFHAAFLRDSFTDRESA